MDRISGDANVLPDLLIPNALEPQCPFGRRSANSRKSNDGAPGQDRSQVKLNLVHQSLIQGLAKYFATAFDEHARDFFFAKFAQNDIQFFSAVDDCARGESIRKQPRTAGQHARARENDAPRLLRSV